MTRRTGFGRSPKKLAVAFLLLLGSIHMETASDDSANVDCDKEFQNVMNDLFYPKVSSKIARWKFLGEQCSRTGLYEARHAALHVEAGNLDDAQQILQEALDQGLDHEKELLLGLSSVFFRRGDFETSEEISSDLIRRFPDWEGGYVGLGETYLVQQRFDESAENLEHAASLAESSRIYLVLTMAYYKLERYRDCAAAMQRALRMDIDVLKHTDSISAAAHSLALIGHVAAAEDLLVKHLKVQPGAQDNPNYQKVSAFVRSRIDVVGD